MFLMSTAEKLWLLSLPAEGGGGVMWIQWNRRLQDNKESDWRHRQFTHHSTYSSKLLHLHVNWEQISLLISWEKCLLNQNSIIPCCSSSPFQKLCRFIKVHQTWTTACSSQTTEKSCICGSHRAICSLLRHAHREHKVNERLVLACVN